MTNETVLDLGLTTADRIVIRNALLSYVDSCMDLQYQPGIERSHRNELVDNAKRAAAIYERMMEVA